MEVEKKDVDNKEEIVNDKEVDTPKKEEDKPVVEEPSPSVPVEEQVDDLLKDGTPKSKEVSLEYERFQTLNEKAKKTEELEQEVEALKSQLAEPDISEDKIAKIVDEKVSVYAKPLKVERERETRRVLADAITKYPDFKGKWGEVRPIVEALENSGVSYEEAVKRAYISVNPEYALSSAAREASKIDSERGVTVPAGQVGEAPSKLTPEQQAEARKKGWDEEKYLKMSAEKLTLSLPTKSTF